ncbi:uncharacterized protein CANTADRAFT_46048 [Suhomyces tanzawaensis NRRL Y-17324]|uniref:Uncharacterized protein n=1 Tax=Suhomyces tanzawaensis NRRL Y-17324 TaxID=984487 RepID=A0A1E4SPS6_9ASCO|nr:uncharacterized protein CANTADRAFT_46048 [Suhomyces tanzawaensis NRRL Y-17324]ODV81524.1 hypothetical protein CANTADRAFT_46048 [Suhomyces tanzawaensis NRRL Y-17324]
MAVSPPTHLGSAQGPPVSPRESPVRTLAPNPAKRHRPKSLNLNPSSPQDDSRKKPNKNADLALRIVSPGLPILNEEMETTVKISQKIELQQRHLIAARQQGGSSSGMSPTGSSGTLPGSAPTPSGSANTSMDGSNSPKNVAVLDDKLSAPTSAKRLKRDNIPTPLTIGPSARSSNSHRPLIQSAPIRYTSRVPVTARPSVPLQVRRYPPPLASAVPLGPHPYAYSVQRRYRPFPNTHVTYLALPGHPHQPVMPTTPYKRIRMVAPHTTTSPYFPRGIRRAVVPTGPVNAQAHSSQQEAKPYNVTDIYHGDLMKVAPLQSQPLSAQREYFESSSAKPTPTTSHKMIEDDRLPVSDEEVREMQEKYKRNSEEAKSEEYKPGQPRAYGYPGEYQQEQYGSQYRPIKSGEIFGSINLMNESIFNFKIFAQAPEEKSPSQASKEEDSDDWLAKEKDKFLKICETSWDEFVNSRRLTSDW